MDINFYMEEEGMYKNVKERLTMMSTFAASMIPLAFPWFSFHLETDGQLGLEVITNPFFIIACLVFLFSVCSNKDMIYHIGFLSLFVFPVLYVYEFLTWHYDTITGEINIVTSLQTAQFGFYLGMLMSLVMIGYYFVRWKVLGKKKSR